MPDELRPPEPKPEGPSLEEQLQATQAQLAELKRQSEMKALQERQEALEQSNAQRFNAARQDAPAPEPMYQAQQELEISDDDLQGPEGPKYMRQIAHQAAQKMAAAQGQQLSQVLTPIVENNIDMQVDALRSHRYFVDLEGPLRDHFRNNPQQKLSPNRVKEIFYQWAGQHQGELDERAAEREKIDKERKALEVAAPTEPLAPQETGQVATAPRLRSVETPIAPPLPAAPTETSGKAQETTFDPMKQEIAAKFNKIKPGLFETTEDWDRVEQGKEFPKRRTMTPGVDGGTIPEHMRSK